jgi:hypothetical protein
MVPLPPDLSRLGDELTAAAARAVAERRSRRRRCARALTSAAAGLASLVVLAPAALTPDSGGRSLLAQESADAVLVRPPDRRPVEFVPARSDAGTVLVRPPAHPLPLLAGHRDA